MHWRRQGSRPEEILHASSRALPAELASVAAAGALNVVEDFLSQLANLAGSTCPCSNRSRRMKYAVATSRQPARGGFTRLITRAAC